MDSKVEIPRENSLDSSLALMAEGYQFISNRCKQFQTNIFHTRLLGQKVICMSGEEAAELFYDNDRFRRKGAAPNRIQESIFGKNAVQTYDGKKHQHRKLLFMSLMTPKHMNKVVEITHKQWEYAIDRWLSMDEIVLFTELEKVMCRV